MIHKYGDMFKAEGILIVTTNATIKKNGALVMGRGAARQMRDTYYDCDKDFGKKIEYIKCSWNTSNKKYGLIIYNHFDYDDERTFRTLGIFQVKYHYKDMADLNLIEFSTKKLEEYVVYNPHLIFNLNYPGIGNGGRTIEEIEPIIKILPDNIHIWRLEI